MVSIYVSSHTTLLVNKHNRHRGMMLIQVVLCSPYYLCHVIIFLFLTIEGSSQDPFDLQINIQKSLSFHKQVVYLRARDPATISRISWVTAA